MSLFRPLLRVQRSSQIGRAFSQTASNRSAKISIVGRLGAKPLVVPAKDGYDMIRYSVATSYGKAEREKTSWFKVACFAYSDGIRQSMMRLDKGSLIWVEGDAYIHKYTEEGGREMSTLRIVQRNIEFLEKRPREDAEKQAAESEENAESEEDVEFEGDEESTRDAR